MGAAGWGDAFSEGSSSFIFSSLPRQAGPQEARVVLAFFSCVWRVVWEVKEGADDHSPEPTKGLLLLLLFCSVLFCS